MGADDGGLSKGDAMADMIELGEAGITGGEGQFSGSFPAYRSDPVGEVRGGLVLIHEIWGLTDHITNVADRFAAEGYLVVAPDLLSGVGVSPELGARLQDLVFNADEAKRTEAQPLMREKLAPARSPEFADWAVPALAKVVDYLVKQPGVDGRIGVVGYCFGGTFAFSLAGADPRIRACAPYYGHPPQPERLDSIRCPILAFYGDQDTGLMESLPDVKATMAAAGVDFTAQVYEGAKHAFFNDTNTITWNEDAATDAWRRTLDFLADTLRRE